MSRVFMPRVGGRREVRRIVWVGSMMWSNVWGLSPSRNPNRFSSV